MNADNTPAHFQYATGQQGMWALSSDAFFGNSSFTIAADSTNAQNYTVIVSDSIPADTSADYVLSGYLKGTQISGNQNTVLSVVAYNSTGGYLGEVGRINLQGAFGWQRWRAAIHPSDFQSITGTIATIRVKLAASNSTGYGNSYFDAVQLQKNPVDTAYNLVDNASFERGSNWPDDWNQACTGTNTWETSQVYAGGRSVSITNATAWAGITYGNYIPYDSTKTYNLTAFVKTAGLTASVAHIKIEEYDVNKSLIGQTTSPMLSGDNDWRRLSAELAAGSAVTGTKYIRPVLMTGNAQGTVYFDNVRLQVGKVTTQYGYDSSNTWLNQTTNPLGNTMSYGYDSAGNITQITDPLGNITAKTYNAVNRITSATPPGNDLKVNYGYDADGNLTTITNTNPAQTTTYNQTKINYNSWGQKSSAIDPLGRQTSYVYTPAGRLQEVDTPDGKKVSYVYDKANRITDIFFNGTEHRYQSSPNLNGKLLTVKDLAQNRTWSAGYDALDRLTSWGDGIGTISYTPDAAGNITQKRLTVGTLTKTQTVAYDQVNQPTILTDADGKVSAFLFNENGQLSMLQSGNNVMERLAFDDADRVTQVKNQSSTGQVLSIALYGYDATGHKTSITDETGQTLTYTYTAKGQLSTETLPSGNTVTYTFDPLGNRTQRQEKKPDGTIVSTTTYGFDAANELTQVNSTALSYDQRGNLTSNGTYKFIWDAAGRLIEVDNASTGSVVATYEYDNQNRRVRQTVNGQVTNFLYDGKSNHVIAEFDGNGNLQKYYTWSPTGQLLSLTVNGTPYYAVHNGHGDIVQLTDGNGNVAASYKYDAWGNIVSQSGSAASLNPYRYADYRYDDATGLYYLIGRYYDPAIGRFISRDPISAVPDYTYGSNDPLSFVDPNGYSAMVASGGGLSQHHID